MLIYHLTYHVDWECDLCGQQGNAPFDFEADSQTYKYFFQGSVGNAYPSYVMDMYNEKINQIETDHAIDSKCNGRIKGQGGFISQQQVQVVAPKTKKKSIKTDSLVFGIMVGVWAGIMTENFWGLLICTFFGALMGAEPHKNSKQKTNNHRQIEP